MQDNTEKIISIYMAAVCRKPFVYEGKIFTPLPLKVSPLIFRDFGCPSQCGACCKAYSLDYLPSETVHPAATLTNRPVVVNGFPYQVRSDRQLDRKDQYYCRHLNLQDGRCGLHGKHPFSCDFELLRFVEHKVDGYWELTHTRYGRFWNMKRIDGV